MLSGSYSLDDKYFDLIALLVDWGYLWLLLSHQWKSHITCVANNVAFNIPVPLEDAWLSWN